MNRPTLSHSDFKLFKAFIYEHIGISLGEQKIYLVQARLSKRLKQLSLESFQAYYEILIHDKSGKELEYLSSLISTNVTSFFRESKQWEFWKTHLSSMMEGKDQKLRIWSAACSSGEEPYSISMFLDENLPQADVKILATDVSPRVLKVAMSGEYSPKACGSLGAGHLNRYFTKVPLETTWAYRINENVKKKIVFRGFNLVTGNYHLFGDTKFDIIFCRNVMIYFDKQTQNALVEKFYTMLHKGGYLFIGSAEALTDIKKGFQSRSASIYQKV